MIEVIEQPENALLVDNEPLLLPPSNTDAEQAIISSILQQPALLTHVIGLLEPLSFYRKAHQCLFQALIDCFEAQAPIEPIALIDRLKKAGTLDAAGGSSYIYDLLLCANERISVIDERSLIYWSKILRDLAKRRKLIVLSNDIQEMAHDLSDNLYAEQAENLLFSLTEAFPEEVNEKNPLNDAMALLEEEFSSPGGVTGLSTGFPSLDRLTHGFQKHQLITVSARPGGGKSAFGLNIAQHVVMEEKKPVLYISLEMTASELMKRILKAMAGTDRDITRLRQAQEAFRPYQNRLLIEDAGEQTLAAIQSKILKAKKKHEDLALIVVDHIGLIASDPKSRHQNRAYEIQAITSRFKALAKTIQTPILQLAQMNRAIEARQDNKPILSDLRDSGSIEMDSDIVLFTHIERSEDRRATGQASLIIGKQRDGALGEIPLLFLPNLTQFRELKS